MPSSRISYQSAVPTAPRMQRKAGAVGTDGLSCDERRMKRKSTYGLTPAQLVRLLDVSAHAVEAMDGMSGDQTQNARLSEHLSRRLSQDVPLREALLHAAGPSKSQVESLLDRSLRDALLAPDSDKALLRTLKDHSKRLFSQITSGHEHLIGMTIYHAAIASALVHHGQRITRYSYEDLEKRFVTLADKPWMVCELKGLFLQATQICRQRAYSEED